MPNNEKNNEISGKFKQGCRVVLLAEDDLEMRLLLSLALQREGCTVIECKDGVALLSKIEPLLWGKKDLEFDLIISDIRMPGITGIEAMKGVAKLPGCPPIFLITAFGDAETHEMARQLGVSAVFDKPFEIEEFMREVRSICCS